MESKLTKNNWHLSHSPATKSNLSGRWYKSVKNSSTIGGKIVANAFGDTKEEAEANAAFIANAKELLQKLKEVVCAWDTEDKKLYSDTLSSRLILYCREVILKATSNGITKTKEANNGRE